MFWCWNMRGFKVVWPNEWACRWPVNTRLVTAEALFQSKARPCGICGEQGVTGTGSYPSVSLSLHHCAILVRPFTLTFVGLSIYYLWYIIIAPLNNELKETQQVEEGAGDRSQYSGCKLYGLDLRGFALCFPAVAKYLPCIPQSPVPSHCSPMLLCNKHLA